MAILKDLIPKFERLTGRRSTCKEAREIEINLFENGSNLGFSQLNEILLLLGFDRINEYFFQYLAFGNGNYTKDSTISSINQLEEGINRFLILALKFYGNVKFAYNEFANDSSILIKTVAESCPYDLDLFKSRHNPLLKIDEIPPKDTYLLGYYTKNLIKRKLQEAPDDKNFIELKEKRKSIKRIGKRNMTAYLASDHLDVYVATSMRKEHEFITVSQTVNKIFKSLELDELKLRWFDPTQAFCKNRIDKGLSEALMLKRAACTLYLAQENDTLGKDSELASTLAQGKPVIAFVPKGDKEYVDNLLLTISEINPNKDVKKIILDQIQIYDSGLAWNDKKIRNWIEDLSKASELEMKDKLYTLADAYYEKRAKDLKETHPHGIQVNLKSGVANGVLVARTISDCIKLILCSVTNDFEFSLEEDKPGPKGTIFLKEKISDCIFRTKTDNILLTNAFWNFYLE